MVYTQEEEGEGEEEGEEEEGEGDMMTGRVGEGQSVTSCT